MRKKGFTLMELLGVIIILGLLIVIVVPKMINSTKSSSNKIDELTENMIYKAANLYIDNGGSKFKKNSKYTYCIGLDELVNKEYLKEPLNIANQDITKTKTVKVTYDNGYKFELKDKNNCFEIKKLTEYITELYTPNSTVTSNNITYNVDTTNQIIDDGLGGTLVSGGNLRYYGATPNNYIDIGDRDADGNVILWRIIGVFETKYATDELPCNIDNNSDGHYDNCASEKLVKVIRNDSIGYYSWDNKTNGIGSSVSNYGSNDWTDARLMMLLNPGYEESSDIYEYEGSLYWNSKDGKCYSGSEGAIVDCDFTSSGLSSNVHLKIENVLWNLGGVSSSTSEENYFSNLYSDGWYKYERETIVRSGRPTEWVGKIGLMYPSDYGYATDLSLCVGTTLRNYSSSTCYSNDWLFNSEYQWTLNPYSNGAGNVSSVYSSGLVSNFDAYDPKRGSRPVLYLKSDVVLTSKGTTADGIEYYIVD